MDDTVDVDDLEPCVPLSEQRAAVGHPSGLNRAQRRAAYERHKAASRDRRLAEQARQARRAKRKRR